VRYLADVNVLIALGWQAHTSHHRVEAWIESLQRDGGMTLVTTAITELGFLRVSLQIPGYSIDLTTAKKVLGSIKQIKRVTHAFIPDNLGFGDLPGWVRFPEQITDGHLSELATKDKALLATLGRRIPGAFVIPRSEL
jgi:predicted nucleic acid-binding protein